MFLECFDHVYDYFFAFLPRHLAARYQFMLHIQMVNNNCEIFPDSYKILQFCPEPENVVISFTFQN